MGYPRYISHKEVSAAKISEVEKSSDGSIIVHLEGGFDNVVIPHLQRNHKAHPEKGWYLVQYADGYVSFSPAKAFEEGYDAVTEDAPSGALQTDADPSATVNQGQTEHVDEDEDSTSVELEKEVEELDYDEDEPTMVKAGLAEEEPAEEPVPA